MSSKKRLLGHPESVKAIPQDMQVPADDETISRVTRHERSETLVSADQTAPDLVDGFNALAAYYRFVEAQAYYSALKSIRSKRNFREEFLSRLNELLAYADNKNATRQIQREIDRVSAALAASDLVIQSEALDDVARTLRPEGYRLLGLSPPLTPASLKLGYRAAAKAYHPDVGGDTATMQCVNDAYGLFTKLLSDLVVGEGVVGARQQSKSISVDQFIGRARAAKFIALLDDRAADEAYAAYRSLDLKDLQAAFAEFSPAALAELLAASNRPEDAAAVLLDLKAILKRMPPKHQSLYGPIFKRTSEACRNPKRIRFYPTHIRQAYNLLRLGIIDRQKYELFVEKIGTSEAERADETAAFARFVHLREFLRLPMDVAPSGSSTRLVPAPYKRRVEALSDAQRREYVAAYHGGAYQLALKYLAIRLDALLRSPFQGFPDLDAVLRELHAIESALGPDSRLTALCKEAITVIGFLAGLPTAERKKRIELLIEIDRDVVMHRLLISADGRSPAREQIVQPSRRQIRLHWRYTNFATGPVENIERYKQAVRRSTARNFTP